MPGKAYSIDGEEAEALRRVTDFVLTDIRCFERTTLSGHVTASAWIVDPQRTSTLLVLHRKLGKWLQPGGHCDGETDPAAVAMREAHEETGLTRLRQIRPAIFDVDVHHIPARSGEREHLHYDIRFLVEADRTETVEANVESLAVEWFGFDRLAAIGADRSVLRMAAKTPHRTVKP